MRLISGRRVFIGLFFLQLAALSALTQDFPLTFGKHKTLESKNSAREA